MRNSTPSCSWAVAIMLALVALTVWPQTSPAAPVGRDQLVIGDPQEPDVLNPRLSNATAPWFQTFLFDSLFVADERGNYLPRLARELPTLRNGGISPDRTTYTIRLRPNVKWHDGRPLTSADVAFTHRAVVSPANRITQRAGYEQVTRVETPDPLTVVFTLREPNAAFLELWAYPGYTPVLPRHVLESGDFNTSPFNRRPIGTGPFKLVEWQSGSNLVLERNPDYYLGTPRLRRIVYRIVPRFETLRAMMDASEIDMRFLLENNDVAGIRQLPNWQVHSAPATAYFHFMINNSSEIMSDVRVRRALAAGLDKDAITRDFLRGMVEPHWSPVPRASWAWKDVAAKNRFDPAHARSLLDEAGWRDGPGGIRTRGGRRLTLRMVNISGQPERDQIIAIAQQMWARIGVDVQIQPVDVGAFVQAMNGGTYDIAYAYWLFSVDPDSLTTRWSSTGQQWLHLPAADLFEYDHLLGAGRLAHDQTARRQIYGRFQDLIAERVTNIFLYNRIFFDATRRGFDGYKPNPTRATNMWNAHEWGWR